MNFNADELAAIAQGPPDCFSKEGLLFIQLEHKAHKKSKGFSERWCCLKGNLLFCMKGSDRTTGVYGVFVLERCSIELDIEEHGNLYSFIISQGGTDNLIYLATRTESEREDWMSHLHTASYECMKMQLENLRENIMRRTGRDPITSPSARKSSKFEPESVNPYLEMCLSCNHLAQKDGQLPNTCIDVLSLVPPSNSWTFVAQTEIVEQNRNPVYFKTIAVADHTTPVNTRIRMSVYDVKELVTGMRTQIGSTTFILEDLIADSKLSLTLLSPDGHPAGNVVVMAWFADQPVSTATAELVQVTDTLTRAVQQQDWCDQVKFRTKKKDQLKCLFENSTLKTFRFPTINNHELSVSEIMAESKLSVVFPICFLTFLLKQNNLWSDDLKVLDGSLVKEEDQSYSQVFSLVLKLTEFLKRSIHGLEQRYSKQTFKPSRLKSDEVLASVPINLHIHRMVVTNDSIDKGGSYDFITVGAFAAHNRGFKQGGLNRMFRAVMPEGRIPSQDRLQSLVACSNELTTRFNKNSTLLDELHRCCVSKDKESLERCHLELIAESKNLILFCEEVPLLTEAIQFTSGSQISSPRSRTVQSCESIHDNWRGMVLTLRNSFKQLSILIQECLDDLEEVKWLEHISTTKMKCDAYLEKINKLGRNSLTFMTIKDTLHDPFIGDHDLYTRFIVVCSQALTAAVTGILTKVRYQITDSHLLEQISKIGCLLHFEGLLSCHKSEMGMLEDYITGVEYLSKVDFKFIQSSSAQTDYMSSPPLITGNRLILCVSLPLPHHVFQYLPEKLRNGEVFKVTPVLFNIGINEMATLAERVGSTEVQEQCNKYSFHLLHDYYGRYEKLYGTVSSSTNSPFSLRELLTKLENNVNDVKKKKNVEVLQLASEICRELGAVQFVSCKSAKDRTSMGVTLEACRILQQNHDLSPHFFNQALSCLRSEGVRRANVFKNTGASSYAFSSFQLLSFPKAYKPPTGTHGKGET